MRRLLAIAVAAVALAGAVLASVSGAAAPVAPTAGALLLAGTAGTTADVFVRGTGRHSDAGQVEVTGVSIGDGDTSARASAKGRTARSSAAARSVSLLGGRITAYGVRRTAEADTEGRTYSGVVEGLEIDGRAIGTVSDPMTFELEDGAGRVVVNKGTIGLRLVLTADAEGLPEGTDLRVAVARANVPKAAPAATATPTPAPTASAKPKRKKRARAQGLTGGKERKTGLKRRKAPKIPARLTAGGYAFPVYGDATVSDGFGAPRQPVIGTHQGNDIFAAFGSPVVAVADGVISRVGTLAISGNRLWLTSDSGDAFFYAHLSAFSPAAVDGARVKAGTVLGFVGNTGDAEPTPPHVHFEIHPGGEDQPAVDPYQILISWQGRRDVPPGAWLQRNGADTTARPGALVAVRDFIAE